MSHIAKMTIIGMYEYDEHLFDDLVLPMSLNKDTFINTLMLNYGEKPTLYTSVSFMRTAIELWSIKWFDSITRIVRALSEEYNPIHNYDRYEEFTDNEDENAKTTNTNNATLSSNLHTDASLSATDNNNTENTVSAYNSSSYQPDTKTVNNNNAENETVSNSTGTTTNNENGSGTADKKRTLKHSAHLYGNIGVTESTAMIKNELDLRMNNNVYDVIAQLFSDELLLYIY